MNEERKRMTLAEAVAKINTVMVDEFEIDPALLTPTATLGADLGLDSLDAVDLVVAVERQFGIRIAESEARAMRTMQDIYACVERCIQAKAGTPS
jgi:acyl carrier protein